MRGSWSESLSGFYFDEHLGVGGELVHEVDEAFSGFDWFVACEAAADEVDFFHLVRREEEFLASGAAFEDIDCWVDVLLGDAAIEDEFHVAGAFEFLEDEFVGAAVGFDEGGGDDGEGASFAGIASGCEEAASAFEGAGVDAAGETAFAAALAADGVIEGAGESCDGVEEHEDVFAGFDETASAFDGELGDAEVFAWVAVVVAGHDLCGGEGSGDFGDFFRAFVDEEDDEFGVLVIFLNGFSDVLEDGGFAGAWGGDDETALTSADGGDEVDDAGGVSVGDGFEEVAFARVDGGEFLEEREGAVDVGGASVDGGDFCDLGAAGAAAEGAVDPDPVAEAELADEVRADEGVGGERLEATGAVAEEAEAFAWGHFEETGDGFGRTEIGVWARGAIAVAVEAIAVWGAVAHAIAVWGAVAIGGAVWATAVIGAAAIAPAVEAAAVEAVVAV
jgi:hypothetical protein